MDKNGSKMHCAIHFIRWIGCLYKAKTLSVLGQKHWVVHDHYSFESLKTTRSSTVVQLSKACPRENGGSPVLLASWSPTSTMSMDKLPNDSSTFVDISSALLQIAPGLMKPTERKVWISGGIFNVVFSFSFSRKLVILFSFFSSVNLYLPHLSGLYPKLNLSFFWITSISLNMPYNFPYLLFSLGHLPDTCFMPEWVIFHNFGIGTLASSPTYMAFTNSKDLKEHSIAFSPVSINGAPNEVAAIMSSSTAILTSYPFVTNLIFWYKVDGTTLGMWIHGLPSKQL